MYKWLSYKNCLSSLFYKQVDIFCSLIEMFRSLSLNVAINSWGFKSTILVFVYYLLYWPLFIFAFLVFHLVYIYHLNICLLFVLLAFVHLSCLEVVALVVNMYSFNVSQSIFKCNVLLAAEMTAEKSRYLSY